MLKKSLKITSKILLKVLSKNLSWNTYAFPPSDVSSFDLASFIPKRHWSGFRNIWKIIQPLAISRWRASFWKKLLLIIYISWYYITARTVRIFQHLNYRPLYSYKLLSLPPKHHFCILMAVWWVSNTTACWKKKLRFLLYFKDYIIKPCWSSMKNSYQFSSSKPPKILLFMWATFCHNSVGNASSDCSYHGNINPFFERHFFKIIWKYITLVI